MLPQTVLQCGTKLNQAPFSKYIYLLVAYNFELLHSTGTSRQLWYNCELIFISVCGVVFFFDRLNEDMMESLFGCNATNSVPKEPPRKSVLPSSADQENRVLDPKKSQNIAILLRALNVTRDEVSEALLDGKLFPSFFSNSWIVID